MKDFSLCQLPSDSLSSFCFWEENQDVFFYACCWDLFLWLHHAVEWCKCSGSECIYVWKQGTQSFETIPLMFVCRVPFHSPPSCDCQCQPRNAKSPWERQLRHYSGSIAFHKRGGVTVARSWCCLETFGSSHDTMEGCLNMGRANLSMYGIYCRLMTSQHALHPASSVWFISGSVQVKDTNSYSWKCLGGE